MAQKKIPKRSEVEKQYTWATEDLFATDALWEEALEAAKVYPERFAAFRGRLSESAEVLYDYMQLSDEMDVKVTRLANYAMRKSDEDTANGFYQGLKGKIMNLYVAISSADSFSTPELIAIPDETIDRFYAEKPELKLYTRKISKIRQYKAHTLSDAEERILALSGQMMGSAGETASAFRNADIKFPSIKDADGNELVVTQGSFIPLMENPDVNVRKAAFESLYHGKHIIELPLTARRIEVGEVRQLVVFIDVALAHAEHALNQEGQSAGAVATDGTMEIDGPLVLHASQYEP